VARKFAKLAAHRDEQLDKLFYASQKFPCPASEQGLQVKVFSIVTAKKLT
jgi:hypothetical protein